MKISWKPCLPYQTSYFIYQSFLPFHGELNLPHPSFAMQERVFYLRLSTEPFVTCQDYTQIFKKPSFFLSIMQVTVFFDRENREKTIEISKNSSVKDLLADMKINPVTVIVSRDNSIITEDEKVNDKDKIRLFSVISGG